MIIKQYFAECFCAGTLAGLGLSWINKYNTKTASRWQQVPALKGSYDAISSVSFSLECYELFVHR